MFDCLKGAILLTVILYHSYTDIWIGYQCEGDPLLYKGLKSIPGIAMGLMFLVSGYGFRPVKSVKTVKQQVQMLLKPYLLVYFWGLLLRIPMNLLMGKSLFSGAAERVAGFGFAMVSSHGPFGIQTYTIFVFWYLIALFLGWMALSGIFRFIQKERYRGLCVCVCVLAGYFLARVFPPLPFCIVQSLLGMGFLYLGYLLKKKKWLFEKIAWWNYALMGAVGLFTIKCGRMDIASGTMELGILDYAGTLCAGMVILKGYLMLFCPKWKIYRPLLFLGRNSLLILCLHGFENLVFEWRSLAPWVLTPQMSAWVLFFLRLMMIVFLFYLVEGWKARKKQSGRKQAARPERGRGV